MTVLNTGARFGWTADNRRRVEVWSGPPGIGTMHFVIMNSGEAISSGEVMGGEGRTVK